jgi:prophage antirepressor-like protein
MTKLCIALFGYENAQTILTRTIDGQRWYMAHDICRLVGISNYSKAVNKVFKDDRYTLTDRERKLKAENTGTSKRQILLVSTNGLYKLIMQADSRAAKEIQDKAASLRSKNLYS